MSDLNNYKFIVSYRRQVDPATGQWMLDKIVKQCDAQGPSTIRVVMPGITIHENPFPPWLQQWLTWAGLVFEDFNNFYVTQPMPRAQALQWQAFIQRELRDRYPGRMDLEYMQDRVMMMDDDAKYLEDF